MYGVPPKPFTFSTTIGHLTPDMLENSTQKYISYNEKSKGEESSYTNLAIEENAMNRRTDFQTQFKTIGHVSYGVKI